MAKDFRKVTQLPGDFVIFDYTEKGPKIQDGIEETYGKDEAERLERIVSNTDCMFYSSLSDTRHKLELDTRLHLQLDNRGEDLEGIIVEAPDPGYLSFLKDGREFARLYSSIDVNGKYMEWNTDNPYPMIPQEQNEDLGCSWIGESNPSWNDFEQVEKAFKRNEDIERAAAYLEFEDAVAQVPTDDAGLKQ